MKLYRPVGLHELRLIADSGWAAFPPRLPEQPIFYPVLDESYAVQIARDWNTGDEASGFCGFVTAFKVEDSYVAQFGEQVVGASHHRELWVPAEELSDFNRHLVGPIQVVASFYGTGFTGSVDAATDLPAGVSQPRPTWRR